MSETKKIDKEKLSKVISEMQKAASEETKVSNARPETVFAESLMKSASVGTVADPQEFGKKIAEGILNYLKEGDSVEKIAGVNVPLVGSEPGVDSPGPGEPPLGKTITSPTEIEKGIIGEQHAEQLDAIIKQLMGVMSNNGPAAIVVEGAPTQLPVKAAEIEKTAASEKLLLNLFDKYAEVETEDEATEAFGSLYKYAEVAEDIVEANFGSDNYTIGDVEKVATVLIENDRNEYVKLASFDALAERVADIVLTKFAAYDEVKQEEESIEKLSEFYVGQAEELLNATGKNYEVGDLQKVATALAEKDLNENASPSDQVIGQL